ncbi:MAG: tRNA (guanosine(46)-N7)-methyltransferase TrmB [Nitrospinaceae bacterium]|nr:tRNA (guanosine(46)-N7)-methyltransferase TrmB [Nitrospinaceae bacterium]
MGLLTARPSSTAFVVEDPCFLDVKENPGWQSQFGNNHPLKLEIGFGMGDFLISMAKREPDSNFIGIDFSQDGIQKLLARIRSSQLKNIRVVFGDVREKLPHLFQAEELNSVYINLPDPWPKKRHFKRRLIKPELAKLIAQKLAPKGHVHLATDSETYAMEILDYFNAEPSLRNVNQETGISHERKNLPKTKYEKSFLYAGDKIHYLEYLKFIDGEEQPKKEETRVSEERPLNSDEYLTRKFQTEEANANDACDLKQVADQLAEAGDGQWAKNVYQKAEAKAEDSLDLNWLAYSVALALNDKDWAKKIYRKAEEYAESSLDLNWLAYSIFEALGDKEWTKQLFEKAESENIRELCDLAESVSEIFEDKEWQLKIYKKAEENAKEYSDFYELADNVFAKLGDGEWASELYHKAEDEAKDSCDLLGLAECFVEKLGDGEGARRLYKKAEKNAEDSMDFGVLADSLREILGDKEWAARLSP